MMIEDKDNTVKARLWAARLARPIVAFARSRKGGAMLIGGSLAMLAMASVGGCGQWTPVSTRAGSSRERERGSIKLARCFFRA